MANEYYGPLDAMADQPGVSAPLRYLNDKYASDRMLERTPTNGELRATPTWKDKLLAAAITPAHMAINIFNSLADIPKTYYELQDQYERTGTMDTGKTLELASLGVGGGALAPVERAAGEQVLGAGFNRPLYHGSPLTDLQYLKASERGPLGPGTYTSPAEQISGHYGQGGKVYELPARERDIYTGAGHRTDEEWFGFKNDKQRLIDAAEPDKREAVRAIMDKMWSSDGYPAYQRLRGLYGGDEGAQNLFKRAGFEGISGLVDGPETLLFGDQPLKGFTLGAGPTDRRGAILTAAPNSRARDPALWHGLSEVKLRKPLSEMSSERLLLNPQPSPERLISPEKLQGGVLLPALGDRSAIGGLVTKVGDVPLDVPVSLEGGHGFMSAPGPHAWASEQGRMTTMANRVRDLRERYGNVYAPYTAMGERAVDFSHHMSDTLSEMVKQSPITKKGVADFDEIMRADKGKKVKGDKVSYDFPAVTDWPGINSPNLREYLAGAPGHVRNKFAKFMDSGAMAKEGFPNVAEARFAVTDPRLIDTPTMASGLSISRLDPLTSPATHRTYTTGIHGDYLGGFGRSIPQEVMFPDIAAAYAAQGYAPRQFNFLMERGKAPIHQETNQRWLDSVMGYLRARDAR